MPQTRRRFLRDSAALACAAAVPLPAMAQAAPRVIVIGGGFGGTTVARELKKIDPKFHVTLVESSPTFTACPFSNAVIGGLRELSAQQFGYDKVRAAGVNVVIGTATGVDAVGRTLRLADTTLPYDRLVLSPGIDIRWDALPGYNEAASVKMPHAWKAGDQTTLLRDQLVAMEDGGLVVMSVPANPFRCPPGPYERASLIAHYLKTSKPKSKLLVLDGKDQFSKQRLFQNAWKELYPDHLEWVSLSNGGKVTSVDPATNTLRTDFGEHGAKVVNVIPPQKAGRIAEIAGVANQTGWCPIDPVTFESQLVPGIHVVGDAIIAGAMPKSAFSANAQGKVCAAAVAKLLTGAKPQEPKLINTCYSLVAPGYGISVAGVYSPARGMLAEVKGAGGTSPGGRATRRPRSRSGLCRSLVPDDHIRGVRLKTLALVAVLANSAWLSAVHAQQVPPEALRSYEVRGDTIPTSLTGTRGDPVRGRAIVMKRENTCLLCHSGPFPEERFQGDLSPNLAGAGSRWTEGQLRLRLVDAARVNPATIMPSYYRLDGLTRVAPAWRGKPILTAEQVEDVVAFLAALRE